MANHTLFARSTLPESSPAVGRAEELEDSLKSGGHGGFDALDSRSQGHAEDYSDECIQTARDWSDAHTEQGYLVIDACQISIRAPGQRCETHSQLLP